MSPFLSAVLFSLSPWIRFASVRQSSLSPQALQHAPLIDLFTDANSMHAKPMTNIACAFFRVDYINTIWIVFNWIRHIFTTNKTMGKLGLHFFRVVFFSSLSNFKRNRFVYTLHHHYGGIVVHTDTNKKMIIVIEHSFYYILRSFIFMSLLFLLAVPPFLLLTHARNSSTRHRFHK